MDHISKKKACERTIITLLLYVILQMYQTPAKKKCLRTYCHH